MQGSKGYLIGETYAVGVYKDLEVKIIDKEYGKYFTILHDGYTHKISYFGLSKFSGNPQTMIDSDYLKYINENILNGTEFVAIEKIKSKNHRAGFEVILMNNNNSVKYLCKSPLRPDIEVIRSLTTKSETLKERIKNILGDFYNYSKTECSSTYDRPIITCPIHGDFTIIIPNTFNKGCGCPECSKNAFKYGRSGFIKLCNSKDKLGMLYLIKCESKNTTDDELFYKIGITTRTMIERVSTIPYKTKTVFSIESDPEYIYDLENVLHRKFSEFAYLPKINFKGRTECFEFDNEEKIIEIISNYKFDN